MKAFFARKSDRADRCRLSNCHAAADVTNLRMDCEAGETRQVKIFWSAASDRLHRRPTLSNPTPGAHWESLMWSLGTLAVGRCAPVRFTSQEKEMESPDLPQYLRELLARHPPFVDRARGAKLVTAMRSDQGPEPYGGPSCLRYPGPLPAHGGQDDQDGHRGLA